jgi:hypothetical protein
MSIIERAKKLVCDMNPHEAKRLNMLDSRSVQTWPKWAQNDFRLACDAMVAVNTPKVWRDATCQHCNGTGNGGAWLDPDSLPNAAVNRDL